MDEIIDYLRGHGTYRNYRQVSTPYCMVRLTDRVVDLEGSLLRSLVCLSKYSTKGVIDSSDKSYSLLIKKLGVSRSTFYNHISKLLALDVVKKVDCVLLINPIYVSIGRRTDINRLYEVYNGIATDNELRASRPTGKRNLRFNPNITELLTPIDIGLDK